MSALERVQLKKISFQILYLCPLDQTSLHCVPIILISESKGLLIIRFFTYYFSSIASNNVAVLTFTFSKDLGV